MSTSPSRSRTNTPRPGDSKVVPILVAVALLLVGAWALKTLIFDGGQPKNILLLGVDQDKTRTDVVLLAHVDPKQGLINVLSVPRDTWVEIPCEGLDPCQSPDKLAHAHAWGGSKGPEITMKTVEKFLGVKVDGYVRVDFEGFKQLVETIGGVDILIDKNMDYDDPTPGAELHIHFKGSPTPQHLNGQKALEYVRFRNDGQGDVGRTERTRRFIKAVIEGVQKNGKAGQIPTLWKSMAPYVSTNLDGGTVAALARVAGTVKTGEVQAQMVPGTPVILKNGPWVWQADVEGTQKLVDELIKNPKPAAGGK
ncbi:MAG TPA: LCP family protein [Symbiobacteriaceae bacterium]|nr:LCP family protein [Symbiobacteriaceae bacterium]